MHIGCAWDSSDLLGQLLRNLIVWSSFTPGHLYVDGRRQAEVQNLIGDVGSFKEHRYVRKTLMQPFAKPFGVNLRGSMILFQRDQDFTVANADRRAISEGEVKAAVRQANIVEDGVQFVGRDHASNFVLDVGEDHFRALDARAGGSARMQPDLTGIHRRKEIATDEIHQAQRPKGKNRESRQHGAAMIQSPIEQPGISRSEANEPAVESKVNA